MSRSFDLSKFNNFMIKQSIIFSFFPGIGWLIAMIAILAVPVIAIFQLIFAILKNKGKFNFPNIWRELTQPTDAWRANAKKAMAEDYTIDAINANDVIEVKQGYDNQAMEWKKVIPLTAELC